MHIQFASRRREAKFLSGSRRGALGVAGKVEPGNCGRIIDVEVVEISTCGTEQWLYIFSKYLPIRAMVGGYILYISLSPSTWRV